MDKTAIFVIEDDAQNGPDHVDAQRTFGYIISPYTRGNRQVISANFNTVSMIRTMVDLLGIDYLGVNDANARSMSAAFRTFLTPASLKPYTAILPGSLCNDPVRTDILLSPNNRCGKAGVARTAAVPQLRDAQWWANATRAFDFEQLDHAGDPDAFNRVLWHGTLGDNVAYPSARHGKDLREAREALLGQ